jgi:hypothetical protein
MSVGIEKVYVRRKAEGRRQRAEGKRRQGAEGI